MTSPALISTILAASDRTMLIRQGRAEFDALDDFPDLLADPTPGALAFAAAKRVEHAAIMTDAAARSRDVARGL